MKTCLIVALALLAHAPLFADLTPSSMFGDHMVLTVFIFMMGGLTKLILSHPALWIFVPIAPLVPILPYVLGIFVCIVQTYVFILLTMSYLAGAVADAH